MRYEEIGETNDYNETNMSHLREVVKHPSDGWRHRWSLIDDIVSVLECTKAGST